MKRQRKQRQRWLVALLAFGIAAVAIGVPLALKFREHEIEIKNLGVIADTRDSYLISTPTGLFPSIRASVSDGQLLIRTPDQSELSAKRVINLLKSGLGDLELRKSELRVGGTKDDYPRPEVGEISPILKALQAGRFANLRLRKCDVVIVLPNGAAERVENVKGVLSRVGRRAIRGGGTGVWRGQNVRFTLKSDGNQGGSAKGIPFVLEVAGALLSASLSGRVSAEAGLRFDGQGELRTTNAQRLAVALGANWPGTFAGRAFAIRGPLTWSGDVAAFPKATVAIDANEASGAVSFNMSGQKPVVAGTLAFDELDLSAYLGMPVNATNANQGVAGGLWRSVMKQVSGVWRFPMVHQIDADFRLSAKSVAWHSTELGSAAMAIALKNGKFSAHLAELMFEGGSGAGQLAIDYNGFVPQLTLRGRLTSAPAGQLTEALFGRTYLSGAVTLTADLIAHGHSLPDFMNSLSGTVETEMPRGALVKLNLHSLAAVPLAAKQAGSANAERAVARFFNVVRNGSTPVEQLDAKFLLNNGQIALDAVRAIYDKGSRSARLIGNLNPVTQEFDFKVLLRPQLRVERAARSTEGRRGPVSTKGPVVKGRLISGQGAIATPRISIVDHVGSQAELDALLSRRAPKPIGKSRL